jgi:hypothetical protein
MGGTLAEFPGAYQVRVGGRTFQVNTSFEPYRRDAFRHRTIPPQRESVNVAGKTGEGTVNSEGLWRYSALDWSYGSGQLFADREQSIANRFYQSKGINPWVQYQISLLQGTKQVFSDAYKATSAISIGPVVFIKQQYKVVYTTDFITFTAVPSLPVQSGADIYTYIAHDNANVYVCSPTQGAWYIPVSNTSVGSAVHIISGGANGVDWIGAANGKVLCSQNNNLYDITSPPASGNLPSPLWTHPESNFVWLAIAAGAGAIYVSGQAQVNLTPVTNTTSTIYHIDIDTTTTNLLTPQPALQLPNNEFVNILFGYTNYIFVGTTQGVRMCRTVNASDPSGATNSLISGPVIPNYLGPEYPLFVTGFCGNNRYVWFTWNGQESNGYDGISAGVGRLDLGTMVEELAPAYASDLMINGLNDFYMFWLDWDPINNGPLMSMATSGIWVQDNANKVSSGYVDQGYITYNIPDDKVVAMGQITALPSGSGTATLSIATNLETTLTPATPLSSNQETNPPTLFTSGSYAPTDGVTGMFRGENITLHTNLNSGGGNGTPFVTRSTLKSFPCVISGTKISPVLKLYSIIEEGGIARKVFSYDDYLYLENLRLNQTPVYYQEGTPGGQTATPATGYQGIVIITEIDWLPFKLNDNPQFGYEGDLVLYLSTIAG